MVRIENMCLCHCGLTQDNHNAHSLGVCMQMNDNHNVIITMSTRGTIFQFLYSVVHFIHTLLLGFLHLLIILVVVLATCSHINKQRTHACNTYNVHSIFYNVEFTFVCYGILESFILRIPNLFSEK